MQKQDTLTFHIKWFVLLFLIVFNLKQVNASANNVSEKFSRNQLQFEKAVSDLHLRFSDEAVAQLKTDLNRINKTIKTQDQIKKAKAQLRTLELKLGNLGKENSPFEIDFSHLTGVRNYSEEERRTWHGFFVPSREEWFTERYRDWGILGKEIATTYNDLFKNSTPSRESFEQLVEKAIENIILQGHFVWFDMEYSISTQRHTSLSRYVSFRRETRDREIYSAVLKKQVLHVLFNTFSVPDHSKKIEAKKPLDYIILGFTLRTNPSINEDLDYYLRLNFFSFLTNESHLTALFETESRRRATEVF